MGILRDRVHCRDWAEVGELMDEVSGRSRDELGSPVMSQNAEGVLRGWVGIGFNLCATMPSSSPRATFSALLPPIRNRLPLPPEGRSSKTNSPSLLNLLPGPNFNYLRTYSTPGSHLLHIAAMTLCGLLLPRLLFLAPIVLSIQRRAEFQKVLPIAARALGKGLVVLGSSSAIINFPVVVVRTLHIANGFWNDTVLLLNDIRAADRQELERFQWAQEQEAVLAAKQMGRQRPDLNLVPPRFLLGRIMPVSRQTSSVRDPEPLVQLAEVAGRQTGFGTGNAAHFGVPAPSAIKGPQEGTSPSLCLLPIIPLWSPGFLHSTLIVLRMNISSPRQENSTLASALRDTLTSLEARQGELEQLTASASLSSQRQGEYDHLMDQVQALQCLLPGPVDKPLVDHFQDFKESHCTACEDRDSLWWIHSPKEEVHHFRERALFVEKIVREYPEEGSYLVSLPPLAEVQVFSWLWSSWRLLEVSMLSSTFDPSVAYSGFFITLLRERRHAGFVVPFNDSLEPPLHHQMFALEMALPHHGLGNWEDLVPAIPSLDQAMQAWEAMMLDLIHCVTDTPPPGSVSYQEVGVDPCGVDSPPPDVHLFLPDSTSPASPLLPDPSPPPPPLFGTVATLAIDLTGEDDDEDIYESPSSRRRRLEREVMDADGMEVDEGVPVKSESSVA
ncbi:hypothetical protein F5876DRAFT_65635 [Lentinula aff. lateritia]|uniref:Uncharacterized protein n=1 Tax=Lentinula aff. lateritia TaxID=2804960 RepID=A0ACC1U058_9AGAR|nr:hypothetical protein F5876DRAFT_65635 [Lentinula aff. lateritia]